MSIRCKKRHYLWCFSNMHHEFTTHSKHETQTPQKGKWLVVPHYTNHTQKSWITGQGPEFSCPESISAFSLQITICPSNYHSAQFDEETFHFHYFKGASNRVQIFASVLVAQQQTIKFCRYLSSCVQMIKLKSLWPQSSSNVHYIAASVEWSGSCSFQKEKFTTRHHRVGNCFLIR